MAETVPAAVMRGAGALEIEDFPMPSVDADAGLLRVEATGLVGADYELYNDYDNVLGPAYGFTFPFIPGHVVTGRIEKLGAIARERWQMNEGDRVLLQYNVLCNYCAHCIVGELHACENLKGYGLWNDYTSPPYLWGGAAEFMMLHPNTKMVRIPEGPDAASVLLLERLADQSRWLLELGQLNAEHAVVIMGTGALAQAAVTVAKMTGAAPVIAVARSSSGRIEQMRNLGADYVFTGSRDEVSSAVAEVTKGKMASLVVDLTSRDALDATEVAMGALGFRGRLVQVAFKVPGPMQGIDTADLLNKEISIIGAHGHELQHLQWAATCLDRPECATYLASKVVRYELKDTKAALDRPLTLDGATMAVIYPHGMP
jgi:threonine dehydrogenase-like Zn-dependent dehydrogenase